ncbi:MAG TPA: hypothetical protein VM755_16745 [Stellaceae bacterium]|nr:hypothetical protein [Stellaceae bacterium]
MNEAQQADRPAERKPDRIPAVSRCLPDGTLIELLYRPAEGATAFAVSRAGACTIEDQVNMGGERLVPFSPRNNVIRNEVVLLPSEPAEYGTVPELLAEIRAFLHRYIDVAPDFENIAAHYALFTWVYDAFSEVPYIRFQGDFGTGKTRALLVLGSVCCRPFFASGASTVSPIFHILNAFRGTLILDEADFRFSDANAEIVKILNNGNVNGLPVLRTMQNQRREFDPQAFQVFGPKVIAMRGAYDDRALESRFLTEVMGRGRLRADIPINLTRAIKDEALGLRNKLLLYRFRNRHAVRLEPAAAFDDVAPRISQILTPLLSVVDDAATREALVGFARGVHDGILAERGLTTEAQLLEVVRELAESGAAPVLSVGEIAGRFAERFGREYERPITPRWIGMLLRRRLHLATYKSHGRYVLPAATASLAALYERYGISDADGQHGAESEPGRHREVGTQAE